MKKLRSLFQEGIRGEIKAEITAWEDGAVFLILKIDRSNRLTFADDTCALTFAQLRCVRTGYFATVPVDCEAEDAMHSKLY